MKTVLLLLALSLTLGVTSVNAFSTQGRGGQISDGTCRCKRLCRIGEQYAPEFKGLKTPDCVKKCEIVWSGCKKGRLRTRGRG